MHPGFTKRMHWLGFLILLTLVCLWIGPERFDAFVALLNSSADRVRGR